MVAVEGLALPDTWIMIKYISRENMKICDPRSFAILSAAINKYRVKV